MNTTKSEVGDEHLADELSLARVDHKHAGSLGGQIIAEWQSAAHPEALLLGCRDFVADAFSGDLALELGKGQDHVEGEPPHAGGRVEGLGDRNEADSVALEYLDDLREVCQ